MQNKPTRRSIIIFSILGLILLMMIWHHYNKRQHHTPLAAVTVAPVLSRTMPIEYPSVGVVESQQSVKIIPQITGIIKKIAFQPGQNVKAGQLLFQIDPISYSTSVQQADAVLQRDEAQYAYLESNAKRYDALVKLEYVTKQQYDEANAAAKAEAAVVAADKGAIEQADIQLSYTNIIAPVSGKTGNYTIRQGDLVVADTSSLVTINQLSPLWIDFTIPQDQLPLLLHYQQQHPLTVKVYSEDQRNQLAQGKLVFINNTINDKSGTVLLKAEVDNQQLSLWPGLMVTVKIILATEANALVIPMAAIQQDQQGTFVYRFDKGHAVATPVTVNRQVGNLAVIAKGLQLNQQVLTTVPPDLIDGAKVRIMNKNAGKTA